MFGNVKNGVATEVCLTEIFPTFLSLVRFFMSLNFNMKVPLMIIISVNMVDYVTILTLAKSSTDFHSCCRDWHWRRRRDGIYRRWFWGRDQCVMWRSCGGNFIFVFVFSSFIFRFAFPRFLLRFWSFRRWCLRCSSRCSCGCRRLRWNHGECARHWCFHIHSCRLLDCCRRNGGVYICCVLFRIRNISGVRGRGWYFVWLFVQYRLQWWYVGHMRRFVAISVCDTMIE